LTKNSKSKNFHNIEKSKEIDLLTLSKILSRDNESLNPSEVIKMVDEVIEKIREEVNSREFQGKDVVGESAITRTRLYVIALILSLKDPKVLIETGTQHGLSGIVAAKIIELMHLRTTFYSIDVTDRNNLLPGLEKKNLIILNKPVRTNFKLMTKKISKDNLIFFHDSDHSYENMRFEFHWAWDKLRCDILVSDDVESNSAFYEFCKKFQLEPMYISHDTGPTVGIVFREKQK